MAQRLLRRGCKGCGHTGLDAPGGRCEACFGTGYKGRTAVYEIMTMTEELRRLTAQNADSITLLDTAKRGGFRTMHEDAQRKVESGTTTPEEIKRVLF